jgi:hypothetical protein
VVCTTIALLPPDTDALLPNPLPAWAESSEADTNSPTAHAAVSVQTRAVFFNDTRIEQDRGIDIPCS